MLRLHSRRRVARGNNDGGGGNVDGGGDGDGDGDGHVGDDGNDSDGGGGGNEKTLDCHQNAHRSNCRIGKSYTKNDIS